VVPYQGVCHITVVAEEPCSSRIGFLHIVPAPSD
jgi:hypothetical protein